LNFYFDKVATLYYLARRICSLVRGWRKVLKNHRRQFRNPIILFDWQIHFCLQKFYWIYLNGGLKQNWKQFVAATEKQHHHLKQGIHSKGYLYSWNYISSAVLG